MLIAARVEKNYRAILISGALAMLGYLVLAGWDSSGAVWGAMAQVPIAGALGVLGLSLLNYWLRFVRWQDYLRACGHRLPTGQALRYYLAGFSFTTTPGKVGEAVRGLYLKQHGVAYARSFAMFVAERISDLAAMILLAALTLIRFPQYRIAVFSLAAAMLAFLFALQYRRVLAYARHQLRRHVAGRARTLGLRLVRLIQTCSLLLRTRRLLWGLALSLLAWGAEGVGFYYILQFLQLDVPLATAVGIYSISVLIGALSFLPGGLGSTEAVMVLLLVMTGAGNAEAIAATLLCRVATLWFAVAIGGGALVGLPRPRAETTGAEPHS